MVGGGASGLMAANVVQDYVKKWGMAPFVIEGNNKMAKKLLATGNGRCNLSNREINPRHYHGDKLAAEVLKQLSPEEVREQISQKGILTWEDREGRIYPYGNQAAAVAETLIQGSGSWDYGSPVISVKKELDEEYGEKLFHVATANGKTHKAEAVILACGGRSYPALSLGASGYELAKSLGHTVTELVPSLVPLKTDKPIRQLKGMRAKAGLRLYKGKKLVYEESGEVIFGEKHLSGICVFNASAYLRELGPGETELSLDLFRDLSREEVLGYLKDVRENQPLWSKGDLFAGSLNLKVGRALTKELGFDSSFRVHSLSDRDLERAARLAKDWRFPVTGVGSWEEAQVTAGGVPLSEIDLKTMESKRCPGLFLTGELLDVDGECGGYNLHWAWLTGILAGRAAARIRQYSD